MTIDATHPDRSLPAQKSASILSRIAARLFSIDHRIVGIHTFIISLAYMALGGLLAMLMRWQLAWPDRPIPLLSAMMGWPGGLPPEAYLQTLSMHGTIMIFFVIIPLLVSAFGNVLIPPQIGSGRMQYPFLTGLSFWLALPAGAVLLAGFALRSGPPVSGWTAYAPLSALVTARDTTWPASAVAINFISLGLLALFVCSHVLRSARRWLDRCISIVVAIAFAISGVRLLQAVAFDGQSAWFVSLMILSVASVVGAVNQMTTILLRRRAGLRMFELPLTTWSLLITGAIAVLATPVLTAAMLLNLLDHHRATSFFIAGDWLASGKAQPMLAGDGSALLHQHLFWFYSHPAVYIMILPAMGMVSDIIAAGARRPVFGYRAMVGAMAAIGILGFMVWAHHMFQSGMNPALGSTFALSSMVIAVPSGIKVFNWLATLWKGHIRFTTSMLMALTFVSMFVIGGLSGIFAGAAAVDVQIHDSYFIVAHLHYVLFGGSLFGIFAGIYYFYPAMFGHSLGERLGRTHWLLSLVAFHCTFFAMHSLGLNGLPRRYASFAQSSQFAPFQPVNQFISISAFVLGTAQLILLWNIIRSAIRNRKEAEFSPRRHEDTKA